jgi:hypothetical protein
MDSRGRPEEMDQRYSLALSVRIDSTRTSVSRLVCLGQAGFLRHVRRLPTFG